MYTIKGSFAPTSMHHLTYPILLNRRFEIELSKRRNWSPSGTGEECALMRIFGLR